MAGDQIQQSESLWQIKFFLKHFFSTFVVLYLNGLEALR